MVGERIRNAVDREPVWRKVEDAVEEPAFRLRQMPGRQLRKRVPEFKHRNIGGGSTTGAVGAAIAVILEDTVGLPFGADSSVVGVEPGDGEGVSIYDIEVNAPSENMARARAFIDAGTGFTTLLTDALDVANVQVLKTRMVRDTYRVRVRVED